MGLARSDVENHGPEACCRRESRDGEQCSDEVGGFRLEQLSASAAANIDSVSAIRYCWMRWKEGPTPRDLAVARSKQEKDWRRGVVGVSVLSNAGHQDDEVEGSLVFPPR